MPDNLPILTGRALKVSVVLDPAEVAALSAREGEAKAVLRIRIGNRSVSANIAMKSLRKAAATIRQAGPEACFALLQGKLGPGDVIEECGLVAQIKAPPKVAV